MSIAPTRSFLKVVGLLAVLSLAPLSIYLLYNRTGGPESKQEMLFQRNLRLAFMAAGDEIDLAPLTEWPFVTLCALDSGLSEAEMTDIIGFSYRDYDQLHWLPRREYWTLLFIDSERETNWGLHRPIVPVRVPRDQLAQLTLPADAKGLCVPAASGRLKLTRGEVNPGHSPITAQLVDK